MRTELERAYGLLESVTPLKGDCGRLCGGCCCKGDNNTGMLLFPDENKLFENCEEFSVKASEDGDLLLICQGECDRRKRPLACRMYPLFPLVIEKDGETKIELTYDPRGLNSCPLIAGGDKLDIDFVRAVRRAAKCLARDEKQLAFLKKTGELLTDIIELNLAILG